MIKFERTIQAGDVYPGGYFSKMIYGGVIIYRRLHKEDLGYRDYIKKNPDFNKKEYILASVLCIRDDKAILDSTVEKISKQEEVLRVVEMLTKKSQETSKRAKNRSMCAMNLPEEDE